MANLRLLTTKELCERTGIARWRLLALVREGRGPRHMRIGKTLRFPEDGVREWIDQQCGAQSSGDVSL